ncbi:MAG TPA: response regulator transcription factor [Burkholderiales bacterium]|jgi:two-component system response regulator TtrR|nr:response regulator transcription factor [Burkholderiales bacterium]
MSAKPLIHIVDDDEAMRDSLAWLLDGDRYAVHTYTSGEDFLERHAPGRPACVILDIRMPGISGVEVHERLVRRGATTPVVFVTGHGDVPMAVEAIKRGAFDFIEKPFSETKLMAIISRALEDDERRAGETSALTDVAQRLAKLSPREREVLDLVIAGKMNKTIADAMNISIKTVEAHRAKVMDKMGAKSLAELVQLVVQARA